MGKITYLDDLQQMQADHIWGKVRRMRKQKGVAKAWWIALKPVDGIKCVKIKDTPYTVYRRKVAARFAGRAGRVAQQLIRMGDY